jgi:hypothetical protein
MGRTMAGDTPEPVAPVPAVPVVGELDEELIQAARDLTYQAIQTAFNLLHNGSPQMQLSVVRSLLPVVGRAMTQGTTEAEELTAMRTQLQALNQRLLSA